MRNVVLFNNEYNVWSESCCGSSDKRTLYMEITTVCNAKCSFCSAGKDEARYISLDFVKEILDELVVNKKIVDRITLTGGEPLLYPDLDGLLSLLNQYNLDHVAITTNAVLLDDKIDILEKYDKLKYINISRPHGKLLKDRKEFGCENIPNMFEIASTVYKSTKSFRINTILGLDTNHINSLSDFDKTNYLIYELNRKFDMADIFEEVCGVNKTLVRFNYFLDISPEVIKGINEFINLNFGDEQKTKISDKCICSVIDNVEIRYVNVAKEQELEAAKGYIRNFVVKSDNHLYGGWSDKATLIK